MDAFFDETRPDTIRRSRPLFTLNHESLPRVQGYRKGEYYSIYPLPSPVRTSPVTGSGRQP